MIEAVKSPPKSYITLKQRVKDKHAKTLLKLSKEVNFVFNYINDLSFQHILKKKQFLSAFDIAQYTKGVAGLGERNWSCAECGISHDRDINSANNILMRGHAHLAKGIPFL